MNDKLLRFAEKRPEEASQEPISLVISEVPSKVAYDLLTVALATGKGFSQEEIRKQVEARVNGSSLAISFPELQMGLSKMPEILNEEHIISSSTHMHTFDENGICICGARRVEKMQDPIPIVPDIPDEVVTPEMEDWERNIMMEESQNIPRDDITPNERERQL